tara:strand:+ start:523 stop:1488 length:966 start_codon:yes stop_codon:yes gene_type:complete
MNKLKEYAGLLNEAAPKNHFLAYINQDEAKMLKDAGGAGLLTPQGIPSYFTAAQAATQGSAGGQAMSPGTSTTGGSRNTGGGGNNNNNNNNNNNSNEDIDSTYTDTSFDVPPEKSTIDKIKDFFSGGGTVGAIGRAISPISASIQAKAMTWGLNRKIKSQMKNLDLNNPNTMKDPKIMDLQKDLQGVQDGTFKQSDYTKKYGSGDATNPLDASFNPNSLNDNDRQELENLFAPELSYAVGGTAPQASMVNQYFSNLGNSNLGISSNYTNTYNQAKANIAKSLNMTPNTQQYGYMPNRYSNYSRSMTSANPFFDELTEQGLI